MEFIQSVQCLAITALIIIKSLYAFIEKKKIINNHFILRLTSPRQLILSTILSLMVLLTFRLYQIYYRISSKTWFLTGSHGQYNVLDKSNSCQTANASEKLIMSGNLSRLAEKEYLEETSFEQSFPIENTSLITSKKFSVPTQQDVFLNQDLAFPYHCIMLAKRTKIDVHALAQSL